MKYHIGANGPAKCKATIEPCPLLKTSPHFETPEEAQDFFEEREFYKYTYDLIHKVNGEYNSLQASKRAAWVDEQVRFAISQGRETHKEHSKMGLYSDERRAIHDEIIEEMLAKHKDKPNDRKVLMTAGLPGAGKSTVLYQYLEGINPNDYVTVNSDDFKEILAERELIPEIDGLKPMEASSLVHSESSHLADIFLQRLSDEGKNVIYDFTCGKIDNATKRIETMINRGYKEEAIQFIYVDIGVDTAIERTKQRYLKGLNRSKLGGRHLPSKIVEKSRLREGPFLTQNAKNVVDIADNMGYNIPTPIIYNNSGDEPVKVKYEDFRRGVL